MDNLSKESIQSWFEGLQDRICAGIEELDGKGRFKEDKWDRPGGGGGRARVIMGDVIEKGGVNFSAVFGEMPEKISDKLNLPQTDFFASGVSIVLHPKSPMVPIIHMNVRYFETSAGKHWFGGGIDVTPHYIVKEDAGFFHRYLEGICDKHDADYYKEYKKWADDYFYLSHRDETRGVGGIFFDHLTPDDQHTKVDRWNFVKDVGDAFVPIYSELVNRNRNLDFNPSHEEWQSVRRGRYVEFNLVHDRGTKFGLETNGRTESILMSMPPMAQWFYNYVPEAGTPEYETQELLKKDIDWTQF